MSYREDRRLFITLIDHWLQKKKNSRFNLQDINAQFGQSQLSAKLDMGNEKPRR